MVLKPKVYHKCGLSLVFDAQGLRDLKGIWNPSRKYHFSSLLGLQVTEISNSFQIPSSDVVTISLQQVASASPGAEKGLRV